MGPFVDSEHPQIKQGTASRLLSHVFQEEIRMRVSKPYILLVEQRAFEQRRSARMFTLLLLYTLDYRYLEILLWNWLSAPLF